MRNFLAVIFAMIAGITASLGLVGFKLDEVIHQPEPIQDMLGSGEAAEQFKSAVPDALGNMASDSIDSSILSNAVNSAVSGAAEQIRQHDDFDVAWEGSLEQTRAGWVADIESLRDRMDAGEPIAENSTDAQLVLQMDPVASVGISVIDEAIAEVTGSTGNLNLEPELRIDTAIPPVTMLTAEQTVLAEELMSLWPVVFVIAGIVMLMALLVASSGSRWIVWLIMGLLTAISGVAAKVGFSWMQTEVLDRAETTPYFSVIQALLRAVQEWADPQLIVLMAIGFGLALLGILGGFISTYRQRRRS